MILKGVDGARHENGRACNWPALPVCEYITSISGWVKHAHQWNPQYVETCWDYYTLLPLNYPPILRFLYHCHSLSILIQQNSSWDYESLQWLASWLPRPRLRPPNALGPARRWHESYGAFRFDMILTDIVVVLLWKLLRIKFDMTINKNHRWNSRKKCYLMLHQSSLVAHKFGLYETLSRIIQRIKKPK